MQLDGMSITEILASVGFSHVRLNDRFHAIYDCEGVEVGHMDAREACEYLVAVGVMEPDEQEPPDAEDGPVCDPLYGERMDSADMGEN
jgi:hypothetical protein